MKLKKLITTHYKPSRLFEKNTRAYKLEWNGKKGQKTLIKGDGKFIEGDFRSTDCIKILQEVDIVVTNPPFSLFRDFVTQLIKYKKKFLIIGSLNAVTYKEIFPLIQQNKIWIGETPKSGGIEFKVPTDYAGKTSYEREGEKFVKMGFGMWFTNIPNKRRNTKLFCFMEYDPETHPTYDNYDAIECSVNNIPKDYDGEIGVPISYITKHNPYQFEIVGADWQLPKTKPVDEKLDRFYINGKRKYARIIIKHKKGARK